MLAMLRKVVFGLRLIKVFGLLLTISVLFIEFNEVKVTFELVEFD